MPENTTPETTPTPETPPAGSTPPNGAPPAGTAPPAGAAPNGQPAGQQPPKRTPPNKRGPEIRIPQNAFKVRVEREAAAIVKKRLGVTLEEAEEMVKAAGAAPVGTPAGSAAAVTADQAIKLQNENAKLRKDLATERQQREAWEKKHRKDTQRLKDKAIEAELRFAATSAGVGDPDYAVTLFARAAAAGKAQEPAAFFAGLKTTHAYLFQAAVPAPPIPTQAAPTTTPPESLAPGEQKPAPAPAGAPAPAVDAEKLTPAEFSQRTRQTYGYTPGA